MKALLSTSIRTTRAARISCAALLGIVVSLSACGGSEDPVGGGSQSITGGDSPDDAEEGSGDACAAGAPREAPDARCDFIVDGLCFSSGEAACACAGCDADACLVLESYPAQIRCATNE